MPAHSISPARILAVPLALCATLALGACAAQTQQGGVAGERDASSTPAGQVVGQPVSCIQTSRIRNTNVHNDETIDFEMLDGMVYRNTLPNRCPSLGFEERFAYRTSTGQLCSTDIITVLHSDGSRGTSCGLGQFLPIELNKTTGTTASPAASQPASQP